MTSDAPAEPAPQPANRRRRLAFWLGGTVLVLVALFLLVVFVLPSPSARYIIESQLERLGIQHEGIDTVDIDLWNSEVSAGPIKFRSADSEDGEIKEAGFDYDLGAIFDKHAFIRTFFVRGVDIRIARQENGTITVNGIDVAQIAKEKAEAGEAVEAAPDPEATEEPGDAGFGAGIENFEFTESRLILEDFTGGTLTMEIERLDLHNFFTWEPDTAGTFKLLGSLNDIGIDWEGSAKPLSDPITIELNSRVSDLTIDKVAKFTGPTGLQRQDGSIDTEVRYDYAIFSDGRVEGTVDGTYDFSGFEIATAEGDTVTLEQARLTVELEQAYQGRESSSSTGRLTLTTGPLGMVGATGQSIEIEAVEFTIEDIEANKLPVRRDDEGNGGTANLGDGRRAGPTPTIVQLMIGWAEQVARNALRHHLEIDGSPTLEVKGGRLRMPASDGAPDQELTFDSFAVSFGEIDSQTVEEGWSMTATLDALISGLRSRSEALGSQAALTEFAVMSESITLVSGENEARLTFDLAAQLSDFSAEDGKGLSLTLASLETGTADMTVIDLPEGGEVRGSFTFALSNFAAVVPKPEGTTRVSGDAFRIDLPSLQLAGEDVVSADFSGIVALDALSIQEEGALPVSAGFSSLRSDLQSFQISPLGANADVQGAFVTEVTELTLDVGENAETLALSIEGLEHRIDQLSAQAGEPPSIAMSGTSRATGIKSVSPAAPGQRAETTIAALDVTMTEAKVGDQAAQSSGDIEISQIATKTLGEDPQSIEIERLSIQGLNADPQGATEISAITIDGLVATLSNSILGATDESPQGQSAETQATDQESTAAEAPTGQSQEGQSQAAPTLRLGKLTVSPGGRIAVTDRSVEPPMQLDIGIDKLEVGPIDTAAPETETGIDLAATVNEGAAVKVQGWAAPLKPTPDFDLATEVDTLPLPPFSPYTASAVGVDIDTGDLSAEVRATARDGGLNGQIDVLVADLYLEPVSDERAEGLEGTLGVPVGFAVGILKNENGEIDLGFPVSGTLDSPEIDYSDAIDKAISGAMASVFPTNWFGEDGRSFSIDPAVFVAGTSELTDEGEAAADEVGELFADKTQLTLRTCGKATADDLMVLRGEEPLARPAAEETQTAEGEKTSGAGAGGGAQAPAIAKPSEQEVEALLALATERGAVIRAFLQANHGIDPARVSDCRISYSIEDSKPPRAEFRL